MNKEVERLANMDPSKIQAPALKAAVERHRKAMEDREAELALQRLNQIQDLLDESVSKLRRLRAAEKMAKEQVSKIVAAKEQFLLDGNWDNFFQAAFR